jgi:hypothetical protein
VEEAEVSAVEQSLKNMGHYRVVRTQRVALEGEPDGISGALLLALTLRETWGRNIEGGAKFENGRWVPETDPLRKDVGCFQISRRYHLGALRQMPGVRAGTWAPVVAGKTAADSGYVPRFEEQLRFTIEAFHEAMAFAEDHGVPRRDLPRFAVAAHNAGSGGALNGYRVGDVDRYTAGGNYSRDIIAKRTEVNQFLSRHPNWRIT